MHIYVHVILLPITLLSSFEFSICTYKTIIFLLLENPYEEQFNKARLAFNDYIDKLNKFEDEKDYPYFVDAFKAIKPNDTVSDLYIQILTNHLRTNSKWTQMKASLTLLK